MFSVAIRAGRLVEARVVSPLSVAETQAFIREISAALKSKPGLMLACTDLRGAHVFPSDVAAVLTELLRADNPKLERSGFLINESAVFSLQIERMLREAGGQTRRTARSTSDVVAWLRPVATPEEIARVAAFLAEPIAAVAVGG